MLMVRTTETRILWHQYTELSIFAGVPMQDFDGSGLGGGGIDARLSEDRRARLREIEIKVMTYQDDLEAGREKVKSGWTISEQV